MEEIRKPTVISLFCGTGGSSLGYKWAGYKELLAVDFDSHAVECFKLNFPEVPVWHKSVSEITGKQIMDHVGIEPGELDVLDGSPPCQGFSTAGKRKVNDNRNDLFEEYVRLIKELEPKVFVMENVSGMYKGKMRGRFIEILNKLKKTGYHVKCKKMNSANYGVPQSRERLIFIGSFGREPKYPVARGKTFRVIDADKGDRVPGRYSEIRFGDKILDPFKPAPTLTKLGRFFASSDKQYGINSLLSFCSFPAGWLLTGSYNQRKNRLGNAVMPKFMQAIAETIKTEILSKS